MTNRSSSAKGAAGETTPPAHPRNGNWILAATILGSSMAFIDSTAVTVALPAMGSVFHATANQIQWIIEAYALFLASLLLVGGSLGDLYGRRRVFCIGVALFAAGSAWCGLGQSIWMLLAARSMQGVGAALLLPGSLALISASFGPDERGKAIGIWSGASAITAAVGPVLGGWLVDHASWRWVFFINLPIAAAILVIAFWRLQESRNAELTSGLDWAGALLATLALGGITFALIEARRPGLAVPLTACLGVVCLVALPFVEARLKSPMLPLRFFRDPTFTSANLITLFLYTALSGLLFFFPLNLIQVQHYSATEAGAALLPLILVMFVLSRWSGGLLGRYGARTPLTVGSLVAAVGFALAARPGVGGSYWVTFFPAVTVLGLGMAITVAPLTTTVLNAVPLAQSGVASGINNAVSRLAGLLSVAVFGFILLNASRADMAHRLGALPLVPGQRQALIAERSQLGEIHSTNPQVEQAMAASFVFGFRRILWWAVGLCVACAVCARFVAEHPAPEESPEKGHEELVAT